MARFSAVFRERIENLGFAMRDAAGAIKDARKRAGWERHDRNLLRRSPDPEAEAEAAKRLAAEEKSIASRYGCPPDWTVEENDRAFAKALQKVRGRR